MTASARTLIAGRILSGSMALDEGLLAIEEGRIVYAGPEKDYGYQGPADIHRLDPDMMVLPGLVDLHCHGGFGTDFPSADEEAARKTISSLHRSGTTTLLASLVTASREDLLRAISSFTALAAEGMIAGIHLEGPFLSTDRCGAQNPRWIRNPDLALADELLSAGRGAVKTMTYAPELPRAVELVDLLISRGVVPSVGHTDADTVTTRKFLLHAHGQLSDVDAEVGTGRTGTVTHLFNGMPPMHHRSPGPVPACLQAAKAGKAVLELIADNTHLDPQMVSTVFDLVGAGNIALVTDSMAAAGLADGTYALGPSTVQVREGVARLSTTGAIAGGTATLLEVLQRTIAGGVAPREAVRAASATPARILGLSGDVGDLRPGLRADLIAVSREFQLQAVMRSGTWLEPLLPRKP
ncbi:N-acetylglucosamine-6-phosphate deacetylase [Arthrobacter sp. ISL-48]|uniref:N-acetylglucosamine-6-phosphate deacetylase n=1 Tax=Arthrobacter sp. ISL-48 TaxID=2819110 RepID=UPI001BEA050D|nr:N-acetylglucosamine-6-phosphate deacetylase [Arthrobacter sp. ISL-48]MBT2532580.1 N-acetylglucosamine-6-phosphate deacetylase [Arthrobacter sp. ISL-48]